MKALFLDRDGVINVDSGYVYKKNKFVFIDGIFSLCRNAISKGYLIIVITNQAGIGRGYYSQKDYEILTSWMCKKFLSENVLISKVYYSPYHPEYGLGKYKKDHESRKPRPGMINQAIQDFNITAKDSVLIGDKFSDILAGINAGIKKNILLSTEDKINEEHKGRYHQIIALHEANNFIEGS